MSGVALGERLAATRAAGRKLFVPYVMAGSTPTWLESVSALVEAGADAIEVGIPFSDPIIDGPVIQAAATAALAAGTTTASVVEALGAVELGVPLVAMTYLNVFARHGYDAAAALLSRGSVSGVIIADLPLGELAAWRAAAAPVAIETVLLAAPSSSPGRLDEICERSQGFVYAVGRMATTGEAAELDPRGATLVSELRRRTKLPVLLGIGISTPTQATQACALADGVVVGSAIVRRMLEGSSPSELGAFASTLRAAL